MIIWINKPKPFEAAVILRFLYYSTGLEDIEVYITEIKKLDSFVRYSRIPIKVIKEKVKFEIPKGNFLIVDPKGRPINEYNINNYSGFVIDFSNSIEGEKVRGIGLDMLHYEAISIFSKLFLKKEELFLENLDLLDLEKEKIYFAKKILEGIQFVDNYYFISPRLLYFCLKNFEKKYKILVDLEDSEIVFKQNKLIEKVYVSFYDKKLNFLDKDIIRLEGNILEIPIIIGKKKKRLKFLVDFDKRRIYISKNFYISKDEHKLSDRNLSVFFNSF